MKNVPVRKIVVSTIVLSLAGACGGPSSTEIEASELRDGHRFSISACCRQEYSPGPRRGQCISEAMRGHGLCAHPRKHDAGVCDAGPRGGGGAAGFGGHGGVGGGAGGADAAAGTGGVSPPDGAAGSGNAGSAELDGGGSKEDARVDAGAPNVGSTCEQCKETCARSSCDDFIAADRAACQAAEQCLTQCLQFIDGAWRVNLDLCYCGDVDHASCVAGGALGVCTPQIESAARTSDGAAIFVQVGAHTPLGVALGLTSCLGNSCGVLNNCPGYYRVPTCGNGVLDPGETCDPPDGITCSPTCTAIAPALPGNLIDTCTSRAATATWTSDATGVGANALWATAPNDVWLALDSEIRHFDGANWATALFVPTSQNFTSIWASGPSDVWLGTARSLAHWNGSAWADVLPFGVPLVRGVAPGEVWATRDGRLFHVIGSVVTELPLPDGLDASTVGIGAFWSASSNDVWAFGSEGNGIGLALHWDGTAWTRVADQAGLEVANHAFLSAWGSSTNDIWMSGYDSSSTSELWHWDGQIWTLAGPAAGGSFGALWGSAADDVWAIGGYDTVPLGYALRHYDGSAWSTTYLRGRLTLLAGSRRDDVWTFGWDGSAPTLYHLHRVCEDAVPAATFTRDPAPLSFSNLVVGGPSDLWAATETGFLHRNGATWTQVNPFPSGDSPVVRSIAGGPPNDVWAAGVHVTRWDGTAWIDVTPPNNSSLYDHMVWGSQPNDIWVQRGGVWMFHWDGSSWSEHDFQGASFVVVALTSSSPTDAWAFGHYRQSSIGVGAHWDGNEWTMLPSIGTAIGPVSFNAAWASSPSNVWILARGFNLSDTLILHYDGSAWSLATRTPGTPGYSAIWASSPDDIWATLPQGGVWHYDGAIWSTINLGALITALAGTPTGELWASGTDQYQQFIYHHLP